MSRLLKLAFALSAALPTLSVATAWADGCYTCSSGSAGSCKDYCRYSGQDTFAARKQCENKGCKVGGPAACPTATNYKVCLAPPTAGYAGQLLAAIPWCATRPQS